MLVPCTVSIDRRQSGRTGTYSVTIARPATDGAIPRGISSNAELSALLLDLGYVQVEVQNILKELEPKKASIEHTRPIDEFMLSVNGF